MMQTQWNILDFGAVADATTLNTQAIQAALDACFAAGGGTVVIPAGCFCTGSLKLHSHTTLQLAAEAVLLGSGVLADYPLGYLLYAKDATDIQITGAGTINGNGGQFWHLTSEIYPKEAWRQGWGETRSHYARATARPNGMIGLISCTQVQLREAHFVDAARWSIHLHGCQHVRCDGVTVQSPNFAPNVDGIDIDSSTDVTVLHCRISTGDDAIVLKTTGLDGLLTPTENVIVRGCHLSTPCNGFKIGTETHANICHVRVSDTLIETNAATRYDERMSSGIALESVDGAHVFDIIISHVTIQQVRCPLFMRLGARHGEPGALRDITFEAVSATAKRPCTWVGLPEQPIQHVTLNDVTLQFSATPGLPAEIAMPEEFPDAYPTPMMFGQFLPASAFFLRHVEDLRGKNVRVTTASNDPRPQVCCVASKAISGLPE